MPVFWIWGGLIPPKTASAGSGISIWNGLVSSGYAGLIAAILSPEYYRILLISRWYFALVISASGLSLLISAPIVPMRSVAAIIGSELVMKLIGKAFILVFSILGVSFFVCMAHHLWRHRTDRIIRFSSCVAALGILSNVKITSQFSSRYVIVFVPFLLIALAPLMRLTWHFPVRLGIGICASLGSLASYYYTLH